MLTRVRTTWPSYGMSPTSSEPVTLAFLIDGQPVPLKRDKGGKIRPTIDADFYIKLVNWRPIAVETRAQVTREIERALDSAGTVKWIRP